MGDGYDKYFYRDHISVIDKKNTHSIVVFSDGKKIILDFDTEAERDEELMFMVSVSEIKIIDNSSTPNVTYIGKAVAGTLETDPSWQIQKIDETSHTKITWAQGNENYSNSWVDRTSLVYN